MAHDDPLEGEGRGDEPDDEDEDGTRPLTSEERDSVRADIEDLDSMRTVFEPQGAKGVVISCSECGANHFYGWELLRESLEHMLQTGEPRMHEPAYEPREDDYVVWDYGKGYVDALNDAGLDGESSLDVRTCAWCQAPLDPRSSFCPQCGRPLAVVRLYRQLLDRGLDEREAKAMLVRAGFEPFA
jgi:RNase P subunit RPR2